MFGFITAGLLITRVRWGMAAVQIPNHSGLTLGDVMVGLAVCCGAIALVGVWWMIYFNLKRVRRVYSDAEAWRAAESKNKSFLGLG